MLMFAVHVSDYGLNKQAPKYSKEGKTTRHSLDTCFAYKLRILVQARILFLWRAFIRFLEELQLA